MYDDLDAFAAVVEHSSLNRASRQLNLSQPALSRKISKLEERLGVALFHRFGKRLELTEVGRLTYTYALEQRQQRSSFWKRCPSSRKANRSSSRWEPA